ncbi:hypothetical protein A0H81_07534 [Grifola frondosa]|uniref:Uncharacterized protein n=1 Tax=Grifola frondosa TaxID=5627 RepID=A0A1C7M713_GRIFR|nr:hypothetical protein A0H81_07534 [Grifola frondosa]
MPRICDKRIFHTFTYLGWMPWGVPILCSTEFGRELELYSTIDPQKLVERDVTKPISPLHTPRIKLLFLTASDSFDCRNII